MTNNTIPNVPRELLERVLYLMDNYIGTTHTEEDELRALLSAPSPAGVDGLEVVGWYRMDDRKAITPYPSVCATWHKMGIKVGAAYSDSAHVIIDGLRGEVAELVKHSEVVAQWHADAMFAIRDLKDANAVRIDELERLLTRAQIWIVDETGPGWELSESIDAALSAGKDSAS